MPAPRWSCGRGIAGQKRPAQGQLIVVATAAVLNAFGEVYQTRPEPTVRERIIATAEVLLDHRQLLDTFMATVAAYPGYAQPW